MERQQNIHMGRDCYQNIQVQYSQGLKVNTHMFIWAKRRWNNEIITWFYLQVSGTSYIFHKSESPNFLKSFVGS